MNSKKSGNSNPKKNVRKVNKKTSMSKRHRDIGNRRTSKTRQQRISKAKPSKRKQQQQIVIKRSSGRKEKFDTNRMAQTVGRSGVPFLMARDVAKTVSKNSINQSLHNQKKKL
jgi:hypothetical protein